MHKKPLPQVLLSGLAVRKRTLASALFAVVASSAHIAPAFALGNITPTFGASSLIVDEGQSVSFSGFLNYSADPGYFEGDWGDNLTSGRYSSQITAQNWTLYGSQGLAGSGYGSTVSGAASFNDDGVYQFSLNGYFNDKATTWSQSRYWVVSSSSCGLFCVKDTSHYVYNPTIYSTVYASGSFSSLLQITVNNVVPTIQTLLAPTSVDAGVDFAFSALASDPGADLLTYSWDLDEDGLFDDYSGAAGAWSFSQAGLHLIALQVSDGDGGISTQQFGIEVQAQMVPEAETYAMMLAGLGLVGFMARKRRAQII